jgi:acyl-CoA synthetase (AMP-forming)/AMP-acid ligase II
MAPEAYAQQLRRIVTEAEPALILCDASFVPVLRELELGTRVDAFQSLAAPGTFEPTLPGDSDDVFIQYSSGSTSDPRGCVLTAGAVGHQMAALAERLDLDPERDAGVNWVPMSHDMGLFGCVLLHLWTGVPLTLSTPERFLRDPGSWLADCARTGATIGATPSFGLHLMARVAERRGAPPVAVRQIVLGGERVEYEALRRFRAAVGTAAPDCAFVPAYGLAEAVLAVAIPVRGTPLQVVEFDREALAAGEVVHAAAGADDALVTRSVGVGTPLAGTAVSIGGAMDVGEVTVRSPFLARGYLERPDATAERFDGDALHTGDLGFIHDGQLHVAGRTDDLAVIAGRNVYLRDVERPVAAAAGVSPGRCTVVAVPERGTDRLVALVESDADVELRALSDAALRAVGVRIARCVRLDRGEIPKTPSGKPQRFKCRQIAEERRSS